MMGCATQGEKAAIIKDLREEGYQLKHLLKGLNMPKSTYCYEISKVDTVDLRNAELAEEIKKIFNQHKGRYGVRRVYRELLRRGNCIDNCIMETFFGCLKNEMYYGYEKEYESFESFSKALDEYISYYSNERIQRKTFLLFVSSA